jgi:hypothetical protein
MEIMLLAVTVVSLLLALVMSVIAWRLSKENRVRSASRIAALAAAAADERPLVAERPAVIVPPSDRVAQQPLERPVSASEPRQAPWRSPGYRSRPAVEKRPVPGSPATDDSDAVGERFLGSATTQPVSGGRQRGLAVAASILFVVLVAAGYFAIFDEKANTTAVAQQATESPLELISLGHQRRNSSLSLTGLVRNPRGGQPVEQLAAVAFLFDREGRFVTSARADVDFRMLAPGDESPFVIKLEAPATVARYRVSFRTDAGVVPHVDRRGQEPIARELP